MMLAGGVGAGEETAFEAGVIEDLLVIEAVMREGGAEEGAEGGFVDVVVADEGIVGGELLEEMLVGVKKRGCAFFAGVPDDDGLARGLKDAEEFAAGFFAIEPVEGLHGGDEVDVVVRKWGGFGGAFEGVEFGEVRQQALGGLAHRIVGFNSVNF